MKKAIVLGAGGFIGSHMVKRLKQEGFYVLGVDLKYPEFSETKADEFFIGDLRNPEIISRVIHENVDELYQFAADMGGAGFVFTGENDADIMHNSALINLNVAYESVKKQVKRASTRLGKRNPAYKQVSKALRGKKGKTAAALTAAVLAKLAYDKYGNR